MENYVICEQIGEGSFGKVFKGRRKFTSQIVALKFIPKHGKTEKDIRSLRQEIDITRRLRHPNIIAMLDYFETRQDFAVVLEYAQGELFEILEDDTKLPETEVQKIAAQLVLALQYLHSHRIIHRDMKPQNILISCDGKVKLCDFGFARSLSNQTIMLTSIKGTPLYMAPELVQQQPYNYTVDLWSLGVILYELYVGQPPFYTNSIYSLISLIVNETVKWPTGMSANFKSFLQGLLNKSPTRRLAWPKLAEHAFVKMNNEAEVRLSAPMQSPSVRSGTGGSSSSSTSASGRNPSSSSASNLPSSANSKQRSPVPSETPNFTNEKGSATPPASQIRQPKPVTAGKVSNASANVQTPQQTTRPSSKPKEEATPAAAKSARGEKTPSAATTTSASTPATAARAGSAREDYWSSVETQSKTPKGALLLKADKTFFDNLSLLLLSPLATSSSSGSQTQRESKLAAALNTLTNIFTHDISAQKPKSAGSSIPRHKSTDVPTHKIGEWLAKCGVNLLDSESKSIGILDNVVRLLGTTARDIFVRDREEPVIFCNELLPRFAAIITSRSSDYASVKVTCVKTLKAFALSAGCMRPPPALFYSQLQRSSVIKALISCLPTQNKLNEEIISCLSCIVHPTTGSVLPFPFGEAAFDIPSLSQDSITPFNIRLEISQMIGNEVGAIEALMDHIKKNADPLGGLQIVIQMCRSNPSMAAMVASRGFESQVVLFHVANIALDAQAVEVKVVAVAALALMISSSSELALGLTRKYPRFWRSLVETYVTQRDLSLLCVTSLALAALLDALQLCKEDTSSVIAEIVESISNDQSLSTCEAILVSKNASNIFSRDIEGTNFGYPSWGLLDGIMALLSQSIAHGGPGVCARIRSHAVFNHVCNTMRSLGGWSNLSPAGVVRAMEVIHDVVSWSADERAQILRDMEIVQACILLLKDGKLFKLTQWPEAAGGGAVTLNGIVSLVSRILFLPYQNSMADAEDGNPKPSAVDEEGARAAIQKTLHHEDVLKELVGMLVSSALNGDALERAVVVCSRLVMVPGGKFAAQYVAHDGLNRRLVRCLLDSANSRAVLVDTLLILSNLARVSADYYPMLEQCQAIKFLPSLLSHLDATVRARVCNFVGNLCRHSDYFYKHLIENGVLEQTIVCCGDSDASVRKFACFALGNAGFHSPMLYPHMTSAVRPLVSCLTDAVEKTRSNAAGALGNLVRNSGLLCAQLLLHHALDALLQCAKQSNDSAGKVALYSLGTVVAYDECRVKLLSLGIETDVKQMLSHREPTVRKYANRLLERLNK